MTRFLFFFFLVFVFFAPVMAGAADPTPPSPIAALKQEGATLTYLGNDLGFDGWLAIKNGQEQYFYVAPGGKAFFLGVLFGEDGHAATFDQLKRLKESGSPAYKELTQGATQGPAQTTSKPDAAPKAAGGTNSAKAEQLLADVQKAAGFRIGKADAPIIYTFVDPLCIHCKTFISMAAPEIEAGHIAIQALPVAVIAKESMPMAAFLIQAKDAATRYMTLVQKEDISVIPMNETHDTTPVQANIDLMMKWKFDGTPVTIYRAKDGKIKIVSGSVDDMGVILQDLR